MTGLPADPPGLACLGWALVSEAFCGDQAESDRVSCNPASCKAMKMGFGVRQTWA